MAKQKDAITWRRWGCLRNRKRRAERQLRNQEISRNLQRKYAPSPWQGDGNIGQCHFQACKKNLKREKKENIALNLNRVK
jgi:hypothetical protein